MKPTPLVCLGLIFSAALAPAQDRDRADHRPAPRVVVYQDADYQGDAIVLQPGDSIDNMASARFPKGARLNDAISSVRVDPGAEVYLYTDAHFGGAVLRLTESARNLTRVMLPDSRAVSWNDHISSLRVALRPPGGGRIDADEAIRRAYRDLLGRDCDPSGLGNYRRLIVDQGWSEEMIRDNIRQGEEFRNAGAQRLIVAAYRDVLNREPRGDELARYRRKILEEKWLGQEIRADLQRSEEYRRRNDHR